MLHNMFSVLYYTSTILRISVLQYSISMHQTASYHGEHPKIVQDHNEFEISTKTTEVKEGWWVGHHEFP